MASKYKQLQITITGGAKSGKTTIMKNIGEHLGIYSLSTGDLFRCHAYIWMNTELPITAVEERFKELKNAYIYVGGNHEYFYKQKNITDDIDTLEMSSVTCGLAKNPRFRKIVKDKIAKIIRKHRQIIIEGRDTGSKILPNAQLKIYIEHDYESRVKNCSTHTKRESLYSMLVWRDKVDSEREIDPFVKPEGAIIFNNSYISKDSAAKLLLQNVVLPKLDELNIATKNYQPTSPVPYDEKAVVQDVEIESKEQKQEPAYKTAKSIKSSSESKGITISGKDEESKVTVTAKGHKQYKQIKVKKISL